MTTIKHYTASWCKPCQTLKPIIQEIVSENPSVYYEMIDVDANPSAAQTAGVRSIPVVTIHKDGVETGRFMGVQSKAIYERAIA